MDQWQQIEAARLRHLAEQAAGVRYMDPDAEETGAVLMMRAAEQRVREAAEAQLRQLAGE